MKTVQKIICFVVVICAYSVAEELQCKTPVVLDIPKKWISMADQCTTKMRDQVQQELTAAMTYLSMGAYFSRDTVNRPGFAKMFFESASEEREHAIKIMSYLLMRGELTTDVSKLIQNPAPLDNNSEWTNGIAALKDALKLETTVTQKINKIISTCEHAKVEGKEVNDYHLVDYLSADFLEEQYKGQRDLAGKISTLGKMMDNYGALGEFLFDKKLLNGEL